MFKNDNVTDQRVILQQIVTETSTDVDVYLFTPNPVMPQTDDMQIQVTLPGQTNTLDFAVIDPSISTLAYMSNQEQYLGFLDFEDGEITDKYPNFYKTSQMAWDFSDNSIY